MASGTRRSRRRAIDAAARDLCATVCKEPILALSVPGGTLEIGNADASGGVSMLIWCHCGNREAKPDLQCVDDISRYTSSTYSLLIAGSLRNAIH